MNELETALLGAAEDFYRKVDEEELTPAAAIQVDRHIVVAQKGLRHLKGIVAKVADDA
jgi:hypothetical protein